MRKQFWAFSAQQFARLLSPRAIQVAVPQQTFYGNFFGFVCQLPLAVN